MGRFDWYSECKVNVMKKKLIISAIVAVLILIPVTIYMVTGHEDGSWGVSRTRELDVGFIGPQGFVVDGSHKNYVLDVEALVSGKSSRIILCKTSDDPEHTECDESGFENGLYTKLWEQQLPDGESIKVTQDLGKLESGCYAIWIPGDEEMKLTYRFTVTTYSYGWQKLAGMISTLFEEITSL